MKINDVELEFNLFEADTAKKVEIAFDKIAHAEDVIKDLRLGDSIRQQCQMIMACFDHIFGEGTSQELFKGRTNLMECFEAFEQLAQEVERQKSLLSKRASRHIRPRSKQ